jgi:homoserine O-acetyltransferase
MTLMTKKQVFTIDSFRFESGRSLPVQVGYETFGTLNAAKDNVVLVAHYFSANSHCAGKYAETDEAAGYWDGLIGPGKAVDTDRYFVISCDNLCNCAAKSPLIYTTGPYTVNPETGKRYGLDFPVPTILDVVRTQKLLLESLGITHLKAVMGPSAGGIISYEWAVQYPDWMDAIIPVIATAQHPSFTSFLVLQHGIRAAMLDPKWNGGDYYDKPEQPEESLHLALQIMNVGAHSADFFERTYKRNSADVDCYRDVLAMSSPEKELYGAVAGRSAMVDLNHWIYTCRMAINHDVARHFGGNLDTALARIRARVLAIPCSTDIMHPVSFNRRIVDRITWLGGSAEMYVIDSDIGHMAGILQTHLFDCKVKDFLRRYC